jgi:hypothetical protein
MLRYIKKPEKFLLFAIVVGLFLLFDQSLASRNDDVTIIHSDQNKLSISYKPHFSGFDKLISSDGDEILLPKISQTQVINDIAGEPIKIVKRIPVTVPSPYGYELVRTDVPSKIIQPGVIAPYPNHIRVDGLDDHEYRIDDDLYDEYKENEFVTLEYAGVSRDRHIAYLDINVALYNNVTRSIEIPDEVIVEINFDQAFIPTYSESISDFPSSTINHNQTKNWKLNLNSFEDKSKDKNITHSLSNGSWYKIQIDHEGVYRITPGQLSNMGINIPKEEINSIKIFGNGGKELSETVSDALKNTLNQQDIIVNTNADGTLKEILFYGSPAQGFEYTKKKEYDDKDLYHYINHYSIYNYYLFTWGGDDGKRAVESTGPNGEVTLRPDTYIERFFYEEEYTNPYAEGSGRTWLGGSIFPLTKIDQLQNLDRNGEIKLRYSLGHKSPNNGNFLVYQNGKQISYLNVSSTSNTYVNAYYAHNEVTFPASEIAQDNRSVIKFEYENSNLTGSVAYFDYYELHYPRSFVPINNEISFFTDTESSGIAEYSINGFSGSILGYDVTDPGNPILLKNDAVTGGMFIFKADVVDDSPKRFYISSKTRDAKFEKIEWADLRQQYANAEAIIITHEDLLSSAEKFRDYRSEQSNMSVTVVTTEHIFNEFGSGVPDITAIRDYIAHALYHWSVKPKYVVLWGDGTYEFTPKYSIKYGTSRNEISIIGNRGTNYLPPYELMDGASGSFDERDSYSSDDFYVKVVGDDDIVDLAIGRMPVTTDNGSWMVDKIDHYENQSSKDAWRTTVTMIADDSYSRDYNDRADFTHQSDTISEQYIPSDFQINKIYLVEYPTVFASGGRTKPAVTEDLLTTVNTTGSVFLNWIGHGNPRVWSHEGIFEREVTIPLMKNMDKLFFLCAATCDFGRFDMSELSSGAEMLLYSKNGGAIGVFAATRVVYKGANAQINEDFYTEMFTRDLDNSYRTLGEAMFALKQYRTSINDRKFFLMGDPTLKLLIPEYIVKFDEINGIPLDDTQDTIRLKALSNVSVKGSIIDPVDGSVYTGYNGTSIVSMLDADEEIIAIDFDDSKHYILKRGGTLSRSSYPVKDGRFTAEFIIPRDISFANAQGRLYGYSYSEENEYAKGFSDKFTLGGINPDAVPDNKGPEIKIYLDSRKFVSGDMVSDNPLLILDLSDESGINATGNSIGHNIEAWIDDNPRSIDLTTKFTNSLDNSNSGTVEEYIYGLAPGLHTVRIRAWDVFNNYSVAETYFRIATEEQGIVIGNMNVVPNPFLSDGYFEFHHNISSPFTAVIDIYSSLGQKITTIKEDLNTLHTSQVFWHGFDNENIALPSGMYYYRLRLISNGVVGEKTGTISYIR